MLLLLVTIAEFVKLLIVPKGRRGHTGGRRGDFVSGEFCSQFELDFAQDRVERPYSSYRY